MANVNRINGFRPVGTLLGGPWTAQCRKMYHAAGSGLNLNVGDIVALSGESDADGVPGVVIATASVNEYDVPDSQATPCGVVVGICPAIDNLVYSYMPGAVAGYVMVCTDPYLIMEVQADGAVAAAAVGTNANLVQTIAQSSCLGTSGQELDASVAGTTSTMIFQIIGIAQRPDNTINSAYNKVLVTFNVHQFLSVGTDGV